MLKTCVVAVVTDRAAVGEDSSSPGAGAPAPGLVEPGLVPIFSGAGTLPEDPEPSLAPLPLPVEPLPDEPLPVEPEPLPLPDEPLPDEPLPLPEVPVSTGDDALVVAPAPAPSVAVTGQIVVETGTTIVVTEPMSAGQSVTVDAHDVIVDVVVE